jgi:hypothetical protein
MEPGPDEFSAPSSQTRERKLLGCSGPPSGDTKTKASASIPVSPRAARCSASISAMKLGSSRTRREARALTSAFNSIPPTFERVSTISSRRRSTSTRCRHVRDGDHHDVDELREEHSKPEHVPPPAPTMPPLPAPTSWRDGKSAWLYSNERKRNAVLGLFDQPVTRDWIVCLAAVAIGLALYRVYQEKTRTRTLRRVHHRRGVCNCNSVRAVRPSTRID